MLKIFRYLKPFVPLLVLAVGILFLQAFCDLSLPNLMSQLVNNILRLEGNGGINENSADSGILALGLRMLGIALTGGAAAVTVSFLSTRIAAGIARDLRHAVFTKVESFSSREFDDFSTASLITRCTNDISQVQSIFIMGIRMICYAPIMGIGGTIMAVSKAPYMSWIIVLSVIILIGLLTLLILIVMPKFKIIQRLVDQLNRIGRETMNGLMVIRAFGAQDHEKKRFEKVNRDLTGTNLFVQRVMNLQMPIMQLIQNTSILIIIWIGAGRIAAYSMEIGDMMAFIQYTMQIIFSFHFISMIFVMLPRTAVSAERIAQILDKEISIKDPENPKIPAGQESAGKAASKTGGSKIEFQNVTFRYEGAEEDALRNISFTAEKGETTAIIGATGSGKTTIANLILRFYDVSGGRILMDGIDIRELPQKDLRSAIGYMPQKSTLLSGPVSFNLRYGRKNATDEEIYEGAKMAQALEFIEKMPGAMESNLAQAGSNVSGGQKQRLSIARALVRNPGLLIFDDSFSALDFATDARLRQALNEKRKSITRIIIAQRVGTIMYSEKIIVLEKGTIAGTGTHEELIRTCAEYREIAESQIQHESAQSAGAEI